jgi:CheY-like chemotaxis protein
VRGITYRFNNRERLLQRLEQHRHDGDLELPCCADLREGEWVLAAFQVGEEQASVPGRVIDRGDQLRLLLESRDWERLSGFAREESSTPRNFTEAEGQVEPIVPPPGCNVLVVEEDAAVRGMVIAALRTAGYRVCGAQSAEEALEQLRDSAVSLVITEQHLPGLSGQDLCRQLRRDGRLRTVPILLLTLQSSRDHLVQALQAGADDVLCKPFRVRELTARALCLLRSASTAHAS